MQLTKLEIKGFKSFAEKVTIHFDDGITGIVGPNGCGKSNIVDSIRWVLGEQKSRVLRSEKMENIIFNGTKARKQTQLAEVSLTFDNTKNLIATEYNQVTTTRRYYRSGESEYLLNGVVCRLKDLTNLFLDTGIASNSYAIIELKMVDDLLNDKDNSRRALFEEAAGISKFKIRKKETLKKLDDTDADLERIEDLLFEIDKNLRSLERQANQAKKYYEIKDQYKHASIALAQKKIFNQQAHHDAINKNIKQDNDKKESLNIQIIEKEARIEKAKADLITKEKLLSNQQKILNEHVSEIRQYESDKKIKTERQKFLQDKIAGLKDQINQDKESSERTATSLEGLEKEAKETEVQVTQVLTRVEELKEAYTSQKEVTQKFIGELTQLNAQFSHKRDEHFELTKELEIKEIQLRSMQSEFDKTREDSSQHSASLEEFKVKLEGLQKEKEEKQAIYEKLRKYEDNLNASTMQAQEDLTAKKEEVAEVNRSLDSKQNEYNLTKSLVDNLEGFPEAIKFLKKSSEWKEAPILSDLISCPEEYRIAIENYLKPYMNYFVVENEWNALHAIKLLNDSSRGKASFFILDRLAAYSTSYESTYSKGIPVVEVLNFDAKYDSLIHFLIGNAYISENVKAHNATSSSVILDKEGKVTFTPYSISGGSIGLFEGKRIGRTKNLELLDRTIKALKKEQNLLNEQITSLTQYIEKQRKLSKQALLENQQEELNKINEVLVSVQTKQEQFSELLVTNKNRKEKIQIQIEELQRSIKESSPQISSQKKDLEELEVSLKEHKKATAILQEQLELKSASYNEENVAFHQKQNKLDSILQEVNFKKDAHENTLSRISRNQADLETTTENLIELEKKSTENDDELVEMYEEKESLSHRVSEAEKEYYKVGTLIGEEEKRLKETQKQREDINHSLMEWQNKLHEATLNLNSIKDRLSVEFNIDLSKLDDFNSEGYKKYSEEELESKVEKLRNRIDSMSSINPMAREAFEEIKERNTFIIDQKEDLLKAKESLLTTVGEIDEVAKETFMKAFEGIKDNFIKVFRTLFTEEDDCDLTLTNPEQPLESAIEIIAKPKGKRPITINQLSGGEKTLTATSLLFSIYLIKPAPFCIFDEVDAPLDDANIDKFNQIIRKFSKESQFIIVTHNKRTMASTDVIYGVTMQEQGVSKVIPVDLRELT